MDKSFGERKFSNIYKSKLKYKNKKTKYSDHRNKGPLHKPLRNYVSSYFKHIHQDEELLDEFYFPSHSNNTYNWWDCSPWKPKVLI